MNIPSPYRLHTFRVVNAACRKRGIDFHVHFMARGHKDRPKSWLDPTIDVSHDYWRNFGFGQHEWNPGLVWHLLNDPPDWLHLGSAFDTFTCIALALFGRKSVLCAGCEGNTKTPGRMHGFIGWFKRLIFSRCLYVTVPGADGARYIDLHQSLTERKMPKPILLPNLVDETRFKPREAWPVADIIRMRESLRVAESDKLCLIPARLEPVKGILEMVALLDVNMLQGWKLVIIGQGSLKGELLKALESIGLEGRVRVMDYVAYEDMPLFYAAADLLLLPSVYDPNPLSLIEAAHAGLPIAASDQCGNIEEAVTDGRNGWRLQVRNRVAFKETLRRVFSASIEELREKGSMSLAENAVFWSSEKAAERYVDDVLAAMKRIERS